MIARFARLLSAVSAALHMLWMLGSIVVLGSFGLLVLVGFGFVNDITLPGFAAMLLIASMTVSLPAIAYGRDAMKRQLRDAEIERTEKRYQ